MGVTRPPHSISTASSPQTPGTGPADSHSVATEKTQRDEAPAKVDTEPAVKPKQKAKAKPKAKEVKPQTPLQRGEDLARQILKKKGEADELALQLGTLPYGAGVKTEVDKFRALFECSPQL
eukprot:s2760_g12.t1